MKRVTAILAAALCCFCLVSCGAMFKLSKEDEEKQTAYLEQALATQTIVIDISKIIPASGPPIVRPGEYAIKLEEGVVTTRLPFFGTGTGMDAFSYDGLSYVFDGVKVNMATGMRKNNYVMQFSANMKGEPVTVDIEIAKGGYATVTVVSSRRSTMTYYGDVEFPE